MENVKDSTARLRRTFQYPTDEDSSADSPEVLDEEEQENLIQTLAEQNTVRNAQFRQGLLALPLLALLPYLPALLRRSTFLISILAVSSLLSTAYLVHQLPPAQTGMTPLDTWLHPPAPAHGSAVADDDDDAPGPSSSLPSPRARRRRSRSSSFSFASRKSPLEQHLPYLNLALCVILVLMGTLETPWSSEWGWSRIVLGGLPVAVYGVVLVAKAVMAGVDPEAELGQLRYEYKGA